MLARKRRTVPASVVSSIIALLVAAGTASAESTLDRATDAVSRAGRAVGRAGQTVGRATGAFVLRVVDLLLPEGQSDEDLEIALEAYSEGRLYTAYFHATRLAEKDKDWLGDEANLLAGLAAAGLGLDEAAVPRLRAVLDAPQVSPYYPVALAALLEVESNDQSAVGSEDAARYLADFWARPATAREAAIKGLFLQNGSFLSPIGGIKPVSVSGDRDAVPPPDRPTDRAVYQAGLALLTEKEFEKAVVCFEALSPESLYYSYARYGLAQASFGSHDYRQALQSLRDVRMHEARTPGERYLRDRAALLAAQILYELDESGQAIGWLRQVPTSGPFGLHAALLAAEIQAKRPALALAYLRDRPMEPVEPKLVAHAAALDAQLHLDLDDPATAASRLEEGIGALDRYGEKLTAITTGSRTPKALLAPLERSEQVRGSVDTWRRQNVSNAIPDLLVSDGLPGAGSQLLASLISSSENEGVPVVFYPLPYDPFASLPPPRESAFDPPDDGAFPALFRRAQRSALGDALRSELDLGAALEDPERFDLALRLLDGELRLRPHTTANEDARLFSRLEALGFDADVIDMIRDNRPRWRVVDAAASALSAAGAPPDVAALRAAARDQAARWQAYRDRVVREAVEAELKTVQELHYRLELELSSTLAAGKGAQERLLRGAAPQG